MITIEEVRAFLIDAEEARRDWLAVAERSWDEIKKARRQSKILTSGPNSSRKRAKYPAWYSIFKIRQPLVLSRVGIPIGKDTTQDGRDNIGATAAMCKERLAVNLAKDSGFFDVMSCARDDALVTNFGIVRAYYEREEVKEKVREYITPQQVPDSQEMVFVDGAGKVVEENDIYQDDEGYFIYHNQTVDVDNEKICLEPVLYKHIYIDPGAIRWGRVKRLAFEFYYSKPEFIDMFGFEAYADLPKDLDADDSKPKMQTIKVYEYWDFYENEAKWLAENGKDFLKPKGYYTPEEQEESEEVRRGLYDLEKLFPCPAPFLLNQSTDEFWPVPEYYQLQEIFEDIHTIFSRMMALTRAIRARLLFDNNVEGLQEALNEAAEGDAFGVPNLAQSLVAAGGSLENVAQYIPVEKLINGLNQLYIALEQRLNTVYKLSGTSDMLQGLITDPTQRTFGERQMTEKYALNQLAEPQRKMQEFVRDSYELLCEMALKNFKDSSLDMYIMPQTMSEEHQQNYRAALGMLKEDNKRFRIELETDSTIALNEQYDKQMRIELVNALTMALEKTANIAQQSPALVQVELHALKYLIQGFRQGKMFQAEVVEAIDAIIKQAQEIKEPPFNKDETMAQLKAQELQAKNEIEIAKMQSDERVEVNKINLEAAKMAQAERMSRIENSLESFKVQSATQQKAGELQVKYQDIQSQIMIAQQELALEREKMMIELKKVNDKKEVDTFTVMMEEKFGTFEAQLAVAQQKLEEQNNALSLQERFMTEQRLQAEDGSKQILDKLEIMAKMKELQQPAEPPVIHVNVPEPKKEPKRKRRIKVVRNEMGGYSRIRV